uniref:Uncharacterized protein n=1 Tax=viral metagenome TaxID=1070528 RepID=A0A6C0BA22_9ZZZZ
MHFIPPTSTKQLIYTYKVEKNVSNTAFNTQYYPTCRPIKHYRKQGVHAALPRTFENQAGFINDNIDQSNKCDFNCSRSKEVGLPIKMLAKNKYGQTTTCCENTQGPIGPNGPASSNTGNIISFSGNAKIKSAIQPNNKSYYTESYSYLKSRGNTFDTKDKFRGTPVATPDSSYYELQEGLPSCGSPSYIKTTYKPNNKKFEKQGAVSCDTRLNRLKLDTIKKNNLSYVKLYKTVIYYSEDPVFFEKNKVNNCELNKCYEKPTTPARQAALFAP